MKPQVVIQRWWQSVLFHREASRASHPLYVSPHNKTQKYLHESNIYQQQRLHGILGAYFEQRLPLHAELCSRIELIRPLSQILDASHGTLRIDHHGSSKTLTVCIFVFLFRTNHDHMRMHKKSTRKCPYISHTLNTWNRKPARASAEAAKMSKASTVPITRTQEDMKKKTERERGHLLIAVESMATIVGNI